MSRYECTACGLTPVDLPDEVDPDDAFTFTDGRCYCIVDDPEPTDEGAKQ